MPTEWYRCESDGLDPEDVLAAAPDQAALDYATLALREKRTGVGPITVRVQDHGGWRFRLWWTPMATFEERLLEGPAP